MIEYSFAAEIAEEDKPVILESKIYKQWLEASEKKFNEGAFCFGRLL